MTVCTYAITSVNVPCFEHCPPVPFSMLVVAHSCSPLVRTLMSLNRRVAPCSLLASGVSVCVSELHHLHGIRKNLVYDSKGQEGCVHYLCQKGCQIEEKKIVMLHTLKLLI